MTIDTDVESIYMFAYTASTLRLKNTQWSLMHTELRSSHVTQLLTKGPFTPSESERKAKKIKQQAKEINENFRFRSVWMNLDSTFPVHRCKVKQQF